MTDWADKDANERLQARDRRRTKRRAAVRASGAACGIDPSTVCGLTQKPCAYAADCAWNEEQRQTVRLQRGKSEGEHVGERQGAAAARAIGTNLMAQGGPDGGRARKTVP